MEPFIRASELCAIADENVVLLDTRPPRDFLEGHIPQAVNLPEALTHFVESSERGMSEFTSLFADKLSRAGLEEHKTAVVYQDELAGGFGQSARAWLLIRALGHENVRILLGGFDGWRREGRAVSTQPVLPKRTLFRPVLQTSSFASVSQVTEAISQPDVVLLDVRDADEWQGRVPSPGCVVDCPRKGRIPRAVWIHWRSFMTSVDGIQVFKGSEEIKRLCREQQIHPGTRVIIYCLAGVRASNTFLALSQAGFANLQVYLGSWYEWSRNADLPIEMPGSFSSTPT